MQNNLSGCIDCCRHTDHNCQTRSRWSTKNDELRHENLFKWRQRLNHFLYRSIHTNMNANLYWRAGPGQPIVYFLTQQIVQLKWSFTVAFSLKHERKTIYFAYPWTYAPNCRIYMRTILILKIESMNDFNENCISGNEPINLALLLSVWLSDAFWVS